MRAMIKGNIRWGRNNIGPGGMRDCTAMGDPLRVSIRTQWSGDCPRRLLNKETICSRSRKEREQSRVAFAKIDRDHPKNRWVVRH